MAGKFSTERESHERMALRNNRRPKPRPQRVLSRTGAVSSCTGNFALGLKFYGVLFSPTTISRVVEWASLSAAAPSASRALVSLPFSSRCCPASPSFIKTESLSRQA